MNKRDIIIGAVILVLVLGAAAWIKKERASKITTSTPSIEEKIEKSFNLTIPEDVDRADLGEVSGGDGSAVATRKYENGAFSHMVLADLPDPAVGTFYEGWLVRGKIGDDNFAYISTGRLRVAKGGYLLEFESGKDYSDHTGVVVTLEKADDKLPETHILEGSF